MYHVAICLSEKGQKLDTKKTKKGRFNSLDKQLNPPQPATSAMGDETVGRLKYRYFKSNV